MLSRVSSAAVLGVDAIVVSVETDVSAGLPVLNLVGLPDAAVKESQHRVQAAIKNSGFAYPNRKITVNLAPADVRKEGSAFDLPVALGILAAFGTLAPGAVGAYIFIGELSLDGAIRPVRGVLPMALAARAAGLSGIVVPEGNAAEAAMVEGLTVYGLTSLGDLVSFLLNRLPIEPTRVDLEQVFAQGSESDVDLSEVAGQEHAKRALEVAAAGSHNVMMVGPPGSGKTMLARRLATILPPPSLDEALESTKIQSVVGLLPPDRPLVATRPFRSPHHNISQSGMIGGGTYPRPGEVSLAHHGVLFLDELPEFRRDVLEAMRQPVEDGEVTIGRAKTTLTFPARFMLVASMNPCPCGYYGDPRHACSCSPQRMRRYRTRISGPLVDRIDLHIEIPGLRYDEMSVRRPGENSADVAARVVRARRLQLDRFAGSRRRTPIFANAQMSPREVRRHCAVGEAGEKLLRTAIDRLALSARAYHRILKVARTIADLAESPIIELPHITEAVQYRSFDRANW